MRRVWAVLVSMRLTAGVLAAVAFLLVLLVALPQESVDPEAFAAAVRSGAFARFLLVTLGLGAVASSPIFVATLAVLFVALAAVLVDRVGATIRRVRFAPPTEAQAAALLAAGDAIPAAASPSPDAAVALLARVGYRAVRIGERTVWGVKHRLALLGFPVFHASFFLMLAGALQLYLTREVVTLVGAEGQPLDSRSGGVVRRAPLGSPPPARLVIERVDVRIVDGKPVDLAVRLEPDGDAQAKTSRVNHPATWGPLTVLVERAGIAPVLWLVDRNGYTLDRVAVPTASPGGLASRLALGPAGDVEVAVRPIRLDQGFPERAGLASAAVPIKVTEGGKAVHEGVLRVGEAVAIGDRVLRIQEVRYYAGLRLVSERGGALLVLGFALSVLGIVWRMLWYRREVVVRWSDGGIEVGGRCEFFHARFREELVELAALLGGAAASPRQGAA